MLNLPEQVWSKSYYPSFYVFVPISSFADINSQNAKILNLGFFCVYMTRFWESFAANLIKGIYAEKETYDLNKSALRKLNIALHEKLQECVQRE